MPQGGAQVEGRRPHGPPAPGARIDEYEVIQTLGQGAMGVVVSARDTQLGRTVALKLLRGTGTATADARLLREAQAMAKRCRLR